MPKGETTDVGENSNVHENVVVALIRPLSTAFTAHIVNHHKTAASM